MDESTLTIAAAMLALVFVVAMFIVLSKVMHKRSSRRREIWRQVAMRLGGEYIPKPGWMGDDRDELHLEVQGVRVFVDLRRVRRGTNRSTKTYQRAMVLAPEGWGLMAHVYRETPVFTALGKTLGGQDVELGDRAFDDMFVIQSTDPEWLRGALTTGTRRAHLALPQMRMKLQPSVNTATGISDDARRMFENMRQEILTNVGDDPVALRKARMMMSDGVLCVERTGTSSEEAELLAQVELVAAYARDFFAGAGSA